MNKSEMEIRKQPSDEALKRMLRFLIKTSVPRLLAKQQENELKKMKS